jgi:hypothetical protein
VYEAQKQALLCLEEQIRRETERLALVKKQSEAAVIAAKQAELQREAAERHGRTAEVQQKAVLGHAGEVNMHASTDLKVGPASFVSDFSWSFHFI